MEIVTQRLNIRQLLADDWKILKEIWQDFDNSPYAKFDRPHSNDDKELQQLTAELAKTNNFYIALLREKNEAVGMMCVHDTGDGYDIGYTFLSKHHRKGYAKEGCTALIEHYSKKGCRHFYAGTAVENIPSVMLLRSLGFKQTGTEQVSFYKDNNGNDIYFEGGIFELLI